MSRNLALIAVAAAIVVETFWLVTQRSEPHGLAFYDIVTFDLLFAILLITNGRLLWLRVILRVAIGLNFGLSLLDRFGILGKYGSPIVAWGDWTNFVAYTHQVNSFLPAEFAPYLAVAATICEVVLTVTLVLGIYPKIFTAAAAVLLFVYGTTMTISLGFASQLAYGVIVLWAGSWFLATLAAYPAPRRVAVNA